MTKFHCPSNHWFLSYQQMSNEYTNVLRHATPRKSKAITNLYHCSKDCVCRLFSKLWSPSVHKRIRISGLKGKVISCMSSHLRQNQPMTQLGQHPDDAEISSLFLQTTSSLSTQYWRLEPLSIIFLNSLCTQVTRRQLAQPIKKLNYCFLNYHIRSQKHRLVNLRYTNKIHQTHEAAKATECPHYL